MYREVRLAIPLKVETPDSDATHHWLFKDSSHYRSAFPDHFSRQANVDRYHLHLRCWLHVFSPHKALSSLRPGHRTIHSNILFYINIDLYIDHTMEIIYLSIVR